MPTAKSYRIGLVLVTASAIAWSLAGLFTRAIPLDVATLLTWRGIFGALGIAGIIVVTEGRQGLRGFLRLGWPGWLFVLITVVGMICYIMSLRETTVAHVAVIYASVPFVAAALGWLFIGERPGASAIAASLAALVGIIVMVGIGSDGHWFGDLLALGMTLQMALSMVLARRFQTVPFAQAACVATLVCGLVCWPFGRPLAVNGDEAVLLALFGLVNSALGFGLFTLGARFVPAIETALIGALDAPLSPFWVWLVFSEVPDFGTVIGGFIVFVAVGTHIILSARQTRPVEVAG